MLKRMVKDNGFMMVIAALMLTSVITITSSILPNITSPIANLVGIVTWPLQRVATAATDQIENVYDYTFRYEQLQEKLETTEKELASVRTQLRDAQDAKTENDALRATLELKESIPELKFVDVVVTNKSSSGWESTLTLSKGSNYGIAIGQLVEVETGYVVGVVTDVGENWSKIITIIDPDISISATVYRTNDNVMVESDLETMSEGLCKLTYLGSDPGFIVGDEVITSGANGIFPSGLVIGTIQSVETSASGIEKYALVQPAADLSDLGTMMVITDFNND